MKTLGEALRKVFEWLNPLEIMNTYQEWHAFVEGFADCFCPMKDRYEPSPELLADLMGEHHYYSAGKAFGFTCVLILIAGLLQWII